MRDTESFSRRTKEELCGNIPRSACCRRAELYGLLLFRQPQQDNTAVGALGEKLEREFSRKPDDGIERIADMLQCENCRRSFLRGVFLACGNVSDPVLAYQADIPMPDGESAADVEALLCEEGLPPRRTVRRETPVLYYKGNEQVSDLLVALGAQNAAFALMNETIRKELRNRANRERNCDAANIHKAVNAANEQIRQIAFLRQCGRFSAMPDELQQTAELREAHPEATLLMLAQLHNPPITKSGVVHRLQKIGRLVKEAQEQTEA